MIHIWSKLFTNYFVAFSIINRDDGAYASWGSCGLCMCRAYKLAARSWQDGCCVRMYVYVCRGAVARSRSGRCPLPLGERERKRGGRCAMLEEALPLAAGPRNWRLWANEPFPISGACFTSRSALVSGLGSIGTRGINLGREASERPPCDFPWAREFGQSAHRSVARDRREKARAIECIFAKKRDFVSITQTRQICQLHSGIVNIYLVFFQILRKTSLIILISIFPG